MKTLIAEDDDASRRVLTALLNRYGESRVVTDGLGAVEAFLVALGGGVPFDLVCLDIMMPEMDGQEALQAIRRLEEDRGILPSEGAKILMVTALDDPGNILEAFQGLCDGYMVKPVDKTQLLDKLKELGLIP